MVIDQFNKVNSKEYKYLAYTKMLEEYLGDPEQFEPGFEVNIEGMLFHITSKVVNKEWHQVWEYAANACSATTEFKVPDEETISDIEVFFTKINF